ncbi:hypothetical protein E4T38_04549 [Aureobasidium subglaciale]|nr:hypothetical protein E4T38_04549 [Aureobasidium subglaciale]KAI5223886.1 hypothetical protein E4T40_04325 [Aureobasidium subglaciale]KAI5227417.1 hypothetical protein E4T41_04407 [Aureobasidium subglaciale]KAI5262718.1 hypothetical protein E4T46_04293 [Aureobasidium subglaciale]
MEAWGSLLSTLEHDEIESVFLAICDHRLNHIYPTTAITPLEVPRHDSAISVASVKDEDIAALRPTAKVRSQDSPSRRTDAEEYPTKEDFDNAFWASTRQNGIIQYWAPRHTSSPHHNTTLATRTPNISRAAHQSHKGCTAVFLSAETGSLAFNHVAAGVHKVLCWDSNPWSIEGLRRGAVKNRWNVQIRRKSQSRCKSLGLLPKTRIVAFEEEDEKALARVNDLRHKLPPVRRVHCGSTTTSRKSYAMAAAILDPELGGWVYIQEGCGVQEVVPRSIEMRADLEEIVQTLDRERGYLGNGKIDARKPVVEHIQRTASHTPGISTYHHFEYEIILPNRRNGSSSHPSNTIQHPRLSISILLPTFLSPFLFLLRIPSFFPPLRQNPTMQIRPPLNPLRMHNNPHDTKTKPHKNLWILFNPLSHFAQIHKL